MTAPEPDQEPQDESAPAADANPEPEQVEQPEQAEPNEDELPEWAKAKIRKANNEAKNLRDRLNAAALEAEREKMSELERERSEKSELKQQLAQRDSDLLMARYHIPEEHAEFIGEGTFEEKEARAAKIGALVQSKSETQDRPPSDRPVESLRPGASPSTPPTEDHSYPAGWGFQPGRA